MPGNVVIRIGAEAGQAVSEIGKVNKALGDQMTGSQKAQKALTKMAAPAALALGAITVAAVDATKAAMEDQAAQAKLAAQLGRVTDASQSQIAAVDQWITKQELATGVADDQLRPALGKLATATGDLGSAQKELGVALDISAQTGKSLDSVTTALAKGYSGNTAALNKLVPGLDQAVIKTKDMTKVNAELADLTGGAAAEAANTAAGQYQVWQVQMQELKETLGAGLIPVVQALLPLIQTGTQFISEHTGAVKVLVGIIAGLSGAILAANIALKAYAAVQGVVKAATALWTAAQWLLNAALTANPIGVVVVAIAALVAGLIIAYNTSSTFRNVVQAAMAGVVTAFNAVLNAATNVFNWIRGHWTVAAFALGPLGAAIVLIATHFDTVKDAGVGAFNAITSVINTVIGVIHSAISAVESLISAIGRIHIPHISIPNPFSLPGASAYGYPAPGVQARGGARSSGTAGTTINVYGSLDPEGTARAIQRVLRNHERRLGMAW